MRGSVSRNWRDWSALAHPLPGDTTMSKEQKSNKEGKKKPAMTAKEKKAAKKSKKESKGLMG